MPPSTHSPFTVVTTLLILLITLLSTLTTALSISSWTPPCQNLTAACSAIYTTPIPACTASDFNATLVPSGTSPCSHPCIEGLLQISADVFANCGTDEQNRQYLINDFLSGNALTVLCPSLRIVTLTGDGTPSATATGMISMVQSQAASSVMLSSGAASSVDVTSATPGTSHLSVTSTQTITRGTTITKTRDSSAATTGVPSETYVLNPTATTATSVDASQASVDAYRARVSKCIEDTSNPFDHCTNVSSGASGVESMIRWWRMIFVMSACVMMGGAVLAM